MSGLDDALAGELRRWTAAGRHRRLPDPVRPAGFVDFTSNDTLGLARHPDVVAAARRALDAYGAGGRAARLLGGGSPADARVEEAVAAWLGSEAALLLPSGYHANLAVVTALVGRGDAVVADALVHASLIDAMRLSRARVLVHPHRDTEAADRLLRRCAGARRRLIVTEGVFGMDGDTAPLAALVHVARARDAWLVVDEAHAAGVVGPAGRGAWAAAGLGEERLAARIVTGGKALGAAGGLVAGSALLRDLLVQRGRTFVFTTAVAPAVSGALEASVPLAAAAGDSRARVTGLARRLAAGLALPVPEAAIVPVPVGDNKRALWAARALAERGFDVRAVRPPTVPEGTARLRVAVHADHTEDDVDRLATALRRLDLPGAGRGGRSAGDAARTAERSWPSTIVVAGTDTDVGKSVVAALLVRAAARGGPIRYLKPVQTGPDSDTESVRRLTAGTAADLLAPCVGYPLPASPHHAAAAAGTRLDVAGLEAAVAASIRAASSPLVLELAGGLAVPLDGAVTNVDWIARRRVAVVLVARTALGTLNHTLLSLEALASRGLEPAALLLVGDDHPGNRSTLAELGGVPWTGHLPWLDPLDASALDGWIDAHARDLESLFLRAGWPRRPVPIPGGAAPPGGPPVPGRPPPSDRWPTPGPAVRS